MLKQKEYDWKDSNMSSVGSKEDRKVKKESALTEPAWENSGIKVGVEVWRVNKFKIERWPATDNGSFYTGDSYIILNTYKERDSEELLMDVHFWIGKHSTQDEYGTAAYKTVELDTYHDDKPIQHREVQGNESELFKSYFDVVSYMKGGADSGFRRVKPTEYKKRLLQVVGERKKIAVREIPMKKGNLNSDDVFIFDLGLEIFQLNGRNANKDEKFKATQYVQAMKADRGKSTLEVLDEDDAETQGHPMFTHLQEGGSKKRKAPPPPTNKKGMYRISDASGHLKMEQIMEGGVDTSKLCKNDVFLLDVGTHLFVWIGRDASIDERQNAMMYAHTFLKDKSNPFCPVTCLGEKQAKHSKEFKILCK